MRANYIDEKTQIEVELILRRFKYKVTVVDISNWLSQFSDESEKEHAITVLKAVDFFNEDDIVEGYIDCIKRLLKDVGTDKTLLIHPVGDFGKSGTAS